MVSRSHHFLSHRNSQKEMGRVCLLHFCPLYLPVSLVCHPLLGPSLRSEPLLQGNLGNVVFVFANSEENEGKLSKQIQSYRLGISPVKWRRCITYLKGLLGELDEIYVCKAHN